MTTQQEGEDEAALLNLLAGLHHLLAALIALLILISIPLLFGLLIGVSLIGAPGTGTPAAARGPVLEYLRSTGPFPSSGPLVQILGIVRATVLAAVLFATGVGLDERLQLAWYTTALLYVIAVIVAWPDLVGVIIGGFGLLALWVERGYLRADMPLSQEYVHWMRAMRQEWADLGENVPEHTES